MKVKFKVWCVDSKEWERDPVAIMQTGTLMQENKFGEWKPCDHEKHIVVWSTGWTDKNDTEAYQRDFGKLKMSSGKVVFGEFVFHEDTLSFKAKNGNCTDYYKLGKNLK